MRIIADEMISPKIVRVLSETVLRSDWQLSSVYNANLQGQADEDWVMAFARSGGNVFVSADQKMLKREALVSSIAATGLVGIYLPPVWAGQKRDQQLAYFVHWWRAIEEKIDAASSGTAWIVPRGLGGGELREHPITRNAEKKPTATRRV